MVDYDRPGERSPPGWLNGRKDDDLSLDFELARCCKNL